ncbi:MAG: pentapeptide repeat-containing protein [Fidelibacterota bacterium]|nr:MAG: pentapeptide repeat-containing protein [Candidatus Neomarinimicrobiota bacterium]
MESTRISRKDIEAIVTDGGSLSGMDLQGADLREAHLVGADLSGANLARADLSKAHLYGANLQEADLFKANLAGANLNGTNLQNCNFLGANLDETRLNDATFHRKYMVVNELQAREARKRGDKETERAKLTEARDVYRLLRRALEGQASSKDVGMFFAREMVVTRKLMPLYSPHRWWLKLTDLSFGYGERIGRIIISIMIIIVSSALVYGFEGLRYGDTIIQYGTGESFLETAGNLIYFSTVVFTTVGFGDIVPLGPWNKLVMMLEGFSSLLYMAMLIIAIYKRTMER